MLSELQRLPDDEKRPHVKKETAGLSSLFLKLIQSLLNELLDF